MATIYRFIIEQQVAKDTDGRKNQDGISKGAGKTKSSVSFAGGSRGGVEHNRKMRAINPLLNRATGGAWEKGLRVSRAGFRLVESYNENGIKGIFSGPAFYIIVAFVITQLLNWQRQEIKNAKEQNTRNYKQLENGYNSIHGDYSVSVNILTGRQTYNQNK